MVKLHRLILLSVVARVVLWPGGAVFGEGDEEGGSQLITPANLYSSSYASQQALDMRAMSVKLADSAQPRWENVGPTGWGRIWDVEIDPTDDDIVYMAGSSGGGVWKSINQGESWRFISNHFGSQSIGDIEIDPSDHNRIWVGTGEGLAGGGSISYPGDGIYMSPDGGDTWYKKGLGYDSSLYIMRVSIHPTDPNIVFVAAMGGLFYNTPLRGVWRTRNALDSNPDWELVTRAADDPYRITDDSTGCTDVLIHPTNPARIIACMWTAMRYPYARLWTSEKCRVWHSEDTGTTWTRYESSDGLPTSDLGRNTLSICKNTPSVIYLIYFGSSSIKGVWRSSDSGENWTKTSGTPSTQLFSYYGYTFGQIRVSPHDPSLVIAPGIRCQYSSNAGSSWSYCFTTAHDDFHAISWSMQNPNLIFEGDDGGLAKTTGGITGSIRYVGRTELSNNGFSPGGFVNSQIYAIDVAVDDADYRIIGQQDEGTNYTTTGSTLYSGFRNAFGGDGFTCRIDPARTQYAIGCLQYGNYYRTSNRTSWQSFSIGGTRKQWKSPVAIDSTTGRVYCGSNMVYSATRGSSTFSQFSSDLTNGDHSATSNYPYGTVSALGAFNGVCYAGTDDGNVWVSRNATNSGADWTQIRDGLIGSDHLPWSGPQERTNADGWITDIWVDQSATDGSKAYVTVWYFRWGRSFYKPKIYELSNWGLGRVGSDDWRDISGDLPSQVTTTKVIKDNNADRLGWLYCATDYGMYYSTDDGTHWAWMGDTSLPIVNCTDMCIHNSTKYLYVCTYGRGINRIYLPDLPETPVKVVKDKYEVVSKGIQTLGNYPNPVVGRTTFKFEVKDRQNVTVAIYDMQGREVCRLMDKKVEGNKLNRVSWDVTNKSGAKVAAGNYICRLIGEKVTLARKITVKK